MVACQANLRQWGLVFAMYRDDNSGRFLSGLFKNTQQNMQHGDWWREPLKQYNVNAELPVWPEWMARCKDPDS